MEEGHFKIELIRLNFNLVLNKVIRDVEFWNIESYIELVLKDRDKLFRLTKKKMCTTIRITTFQRIGQELSDYFSQTISIDIVPCVHISGWWPDQAVLSLSNSANRLQVNCHRTAVVLSLHARIRFIGR